MSNVHIDAEGWMRMEVHPGLSPRLTSSMKPFYFKFSHERHRMWYHEKETALLCNGSVEMEHVQSIKLKNDWNGVPGFGFTLHFISNDSSVSSQSNQPPRPLSFWCDSEQD